jgi:hypothetical protein
MLLGVEVVDETTKELFVCLSINFIPLVCMVSGIISVMFVPPHRHVLQGTDDFTEGLLLRRSHCPPRRATPTPSKTAT